MGYRDWHELTASTPANAPTARRTIEREAAIKAILGLSDALNVPDGDVQFVLTKARVFGDGAWSLEEQFTERTTIWRRRIFGPPARGRPGAVVRLRERGRPERAAYLRVAGSSSWVVRDIGPLNCCDFEIVTPRSPLADFVPARLWLPYGYWILGDGSQVIYARDYLPMWRVGPCGIERLEPWYWILGITGTFNFAHSLGVSDWAGGPARDLALAYLARHRIAGLPRLVDVMPHLLEPHIETIAGGVQRFRERRGGDFPLPRYARPNDNLIQSWGRTKSRCSGRLTCLRPIFRRSFATGGGRRRRLSTPGLGRRWG